jgi:hypothetical protein
VIAGDRFAFVKEHGDMTALALLTQTSLHQNAQATRAFSLFVM